MTLENEEFCTSLRSPLGKICMVIYDILSLGFQMTAQRLSRWG